MMMLVKFINERLTSDTVRREVLEDGTVVSVRCNQPLFCKLVKSKDKVGSGGRDRTADLGVMNPTL